MTGCTTVSRWLLNSNSLISRQVLLICRKVLLIYHRILFIGKEESEDTVYNTNDIQMYQKLLQTYAQAIKTKDLVGRAINSLNYELEPSKVVGALTVTPVADTQILQIKYKSKNKTTS